MFIGGPSAAFDIPLPSEWYGQRLTKDYDLASQSKPDGSYKGHPVLRHESGWRSIFVPGIPLADLLKGRNVVDLIDMDIEGQELNVIRSAISSLNTKVKRLHIGTHATEIEAGLRQLLAANGWRCQADYPLFSTSQTPFGPSAVR